MANQSNAPIMKKGGILYFLLYGTAFGFSFFYPQVLLGLSIYSGLAATVHCLKLIVNQAQLSKSDRLSARSIKSFLSAKVGRTRAFHNFLIQGFNLGFMYALSMQIPLINVYLYVTAFAANYITFSFFKNRSEHAIKTVEGARLIQRLETRQERCQRAHAPMKTSTKFMLDMFDVQYEENHYMKVPPMSTTYFDVDDVVHERSFLGTPPPAYPGVRPPPYNPEYVSPGNEYDRVPYPQTPPDSRPSSRMSY